MARIRVRSLLYVWCTLFGFGMAQEETHLPDYLVFMKQFMVHVQIREPSGIIVWTRNSPLIETFGFELYVSRNDQMNHHAIVWDRQLLVNTSVVVDGKFLIQDDDIRIEKGETIRYRYSVLHKRTLSQSNFHRILVTDHLFYRPKSNQCYSQCFVVDQEEVREEAARLKDILEQKILQCIGSKASEHLFFPLENASNLVADPVRYVRHRLFQIDELRPLVNNVVTTYLAHNGVGFRMYTLLDKLKVLELSKGRLDVIDFDTILQSADEDSIETTTTFETS